MVFECCIYTIDDIYIYHIWYLYVGSFGDICTIQSRRYVLQLGQRANGHARFQSQHMEGAKSQFFLTQDRPNTEHWRVFGIDARWLNIYDWIFLHLSAAYKHTCPSVQLKQYKTRNRMSEDQYQCQQWGYDGENGRKYIITPKQSLAPEKWLYFSLQCKVYTFRQILFLW